jgi:hypothetical protein
MLGAFLGLVRASFTDARGTFRALMARRIRREDLWMALALVTILSVIAAEPFTRMMSPDETMLFAPFAGRPLTGAFVEFSLYAVSVFVIYWISRAAGGTGNFPDTLLAVTWLQALMLVIQAVQVVALFVWPTGAALLGIAGGVAFLYFLTIFVQEAHHFASALKVFAMILAGLFGLVFGLAVILALIGVTFSGVA